MFLRRRLAVVLAAPLLLLLAPAAALAGPGDTRGEAWPFNTPGTQLGTGYTHTSDNSDVDATADFFCGSADFGAEQWYHFHPHRNGVVTAHLTSGAFYGVVMIVPYNPATGDPDYTKQLCNGETVANPDHSFVQDYEVAEGGHYYVLIGSEDRDNDDTADFTGAYTLQLSYDPDTDRDGIRDSADACDSQSGPASNGGCPQPPPPKPRPDADLDGVSDDGPDKCLGENSRARDANANGCLDYRGLSPKTSVDWLNAVSPFKVTALKVTEVPNGTAVRIRCTRRACQRAHKRVRRGRATFLRGKRLRRGTKVVVSVIRKDYIGRYVTFQVTRRGIKKKLPELCLKPGTTRGPKRCNRVSTLR